MIKQERSYNSKFIQVLIAAVIVNLANGSNYVWSVYGQHMINEGGWSATLASLPYTLNIIVSSFSPLIGGWICDKYSPRISIYLSGVLFFLGWFLCGTVDPSNAWAIILLYGVFLGFAQGTNPNAASSSTGKWAPAHLKGLATGLSHSANGFSSAWMSLLGTALLAVGLTTAFRTMAFISAGLCFVGGTLMLKPEFNAGEANVTVKDSDESTQTYKGLLKTKTFWLIFMINALCLIGGGSVFSQCAMIAQVQAGWTGGYILVVILAIANGGGRILFNALSDKVGVYKGYTIMFIASIIGMVVLFFANNIPMLVIGVILVGSAFGGSNAMLYAVNSYEFGTKALGKAHGATVIGYLFNGFLGSTIAGISLDTTGSYSMAYIFGIVALIISIVLVQILKKNHVEPAA